MKDTKTKFATAYFVATEELPLKKYSKPIQVEEKNGVNIGNGN